MESPQSSKKPVQVVGVEPAVQFSKKATIGTSGLVVGAILAGPIGALIGGALGTAIGAAAENDAVDRPPAPSALPTPVAPGADLPAKKKTVRKSPPRSVSGKAVAKPKKKTVAKRSRARVEPA